MRQIRVLQHSLARCVTLCIMGLALATSCSEEEIVFVKQSGSVSFGAEVGTYRASSVTLTGANAITSMGIYAALTTVNWDNSAVPTYMSNTEVSRPNETSQWTYSPLMFWPGSGKLSFFAYAPYNTSGATITAGAGVPNISFTVNDNQSDQVDLLVARSVKDRTKGDGYGETVTIPLRHSLTKIGFSARTAKAPAGSIDYRILSVNFSGLYQSGSTPMDGNTIQWTISGNNGATYSLTPANGGLENLSLTATYQNLSPDNGYMFLMPQQIQPNAFIEISYQRTVNGISEQPEIALLKIDDAIGEWKPGEAYNLLFTLTDNGTSLVFVPVDWYTMDIDADTQNRVLNITRIDATVHNGAMVRVHFWSNQSRVWVQKQGNVAANLIDHTPGANIGDVNTIYRNLAWDTSVDYDSYNNSGNFHYDPVTGNGWADIELVNNVPAAGQSNPVINRNILMFCAGDLHHTTHLARSVKIAGIVSPFPDGNVTTPYIGTFHRRTQVGERVITWNGTGNWVAVIEATPSQDEYGTSYHDYQHVLIDRFDSPDPNIYTMNFADAEGFPVTSWNNTLGGGTINGKRWVRGNNRIFFRIGWDSPNPDVNRNRYARINIYRDIHPTDNSGNFNSLNLITTLYLRQGDYDDYVMRPIDPIPLNGGSTYRPDAGRLSPYEVFGKYTDIGHYQSFNYSSLAPAGNHGTEFTPFPTIKGDYFKWGYTKGMSPMSGSVLGNATGTDTAGRFYRGWNETATLGGSTVTLPTWTDPRVEDPCPPGYRVPNFSGTGFDIIYPTVAPSVFFENQPIAQSLMANPTRGGLPPFSNQVVNPYPANSNSNYVVGFYADGFYDRGQVRHMESMSYTYYTVEREYGTGIRHHHAYSGALLFNPVSLSSTFFISGGYKMESQMNFEGNYAQFMTSTTVTGLTGLPVNNGIVIIFFDPISAGVGNTSKLYVNMSESNNGSRGKGDVALSVRCLKE